jgi:hypothetical protein
MGQSSRFRIALSGGLDATPVVQVVEVDPVEEVDGVAVFTYGSQIADRRLPADAFLWEARDVDLDDPEALAEWMRHYGPLTPLAKDWFEDLPTSERRGVEHLRQPLGTDDRWQVTVDEVRLRLRTVRALVDCWQAYNEGREDDILDVWPAHGFAQPKSIEMGIGWFVDHINAALAPFGPVITATVKHGDDSEEGLGWERPIVSAYNAMASQIAHAVSREARWRRCPECGRVFDRQRDRSKSGQYRTSGVTYCRTSCARAHAQRDWRHRKAAETRSRKGDEK